MQSNKTIPNDSLFFKINAIIQINNVYTLVLIIFNYIN